MVDDEEPARRSIFAMLRGLGYNCFDEAGDGEAALAYITDIQPDIVLADIRMPGLTGIELLERCRALPEPPSFVFISGYDLFEYAQKAIRLGAQGYLLKPFDSDELSSVLDDVCGQQWDVQQYRHDGYGAEKQANIILSKLLRGEVVPSDMQSELQQIELPQTAANYAVIEFLTYKNLLISDHSVDSRYGQYIAAIRRDLQRLFPSAQAVFIFSVGAVDVALMTADELSENFQRRYILVDWEDLRRQLQQEFGFSITVVPSRPFTHLSYISKTHSACVKLLIDELFKDDPQKGSVLFTDKAALNQRPYISRIQEHLAQLNMDGVLQEIHEVYQRFVLHGYQTFADITSLHREMLRTLDAAMQKLGIPTQILGDLDTVSGELLSMTSTEEILKWYHTMIWRFAEELQNPASASNIPVSILRAKQYIHKNLASSISLEMVSRHVGLSPNYFSSSFKRETGETFGAYLLRIRIEEAQNLLRIGCYKASEVGVRVGFSDIKYFYKVFKKITGVTPGKYVMEPKRAKAVEP